MTFEAFQSYIKENVLKEWREDADIEMAVVRKNNGIELCGLYIRREEEQISPTIYLDEYYSYYLKGEALEEIITRIREEYEWKISRVADYHFNLEKFEYVRDRIVYRLVNYEKNKEILEDCPHLRLYDLALTFRWVAHSDDIGISTALVTNQELQVWGISMNELLLAARENRPLHPGRHTCYNGVDKGKPPGDRERIPKPRLSSDRSLQPDSVKLDSLVIAHQPWRGEYVPGPCTHRPSSHGSWGCLKFVTARSDLGQNR